MQIPPKIRTKFGEGIGVEILVSPPQLSDSNRTFLSADEASGQSELSVDNGLKFAVSQYVLLGAFGAEKSEIVQLHASTAPTATALTLTAADSFAHNRGDQIAFIPYNQVVIERSTDGGSSYSVLTTLGIRADSSETYYNDTSGTSAYYYRARFKNSTDTTYSQYSDGIVATGFAENSAGAIIREALIGLGDNIDGQVITKEFLYSALNEGRQELDKAAGAGRWSFRTEFDYDAGDVIPGHDRITVPSTLRRPDTYEHILSIRIGKSRLEIRPVDKTAMNRWYLGVARTTLNGALVTADTSIVLTSSGDFDEAGAIQIAGAAVSDTVDEVDYTANAESTNTLSGVTGIKASGHATGAIVWQGASFGYPIEYAVVDGEIVFSQPFSDELAGENIWMDFYEKLQSINSDGDTLDETNFTMFIAYMRYRIKKRRNKDLDRDKDDDYKTWKEQRDNMVLQEFVGQDLRIEVDVPR